MNRDTVTEGGPTDAGGPTDHSPRRPAPARAGRGRGRRRRAPACRSPAFPGPALSGLSPRLIVLRGGVAGLVGEADEGAAGQQGGHEPLREGHAPRPPAAPGDRHRARADPDRDHGEQVGGRGDLGRRGPGVQVEGGEEPDQQHGGRQRQLQHDQPQRHAELGQRAQRFARPGRGRESGSGSRRR